MLRESQLGHRRLHVVDSRTPKDSNEAKPGAKARFTPLLCRGCCFPMSQIQGLERESPCGRAGGAAETLQRQVDTGRKRAGFAPSSQLVMELFVHGGASENKREGKETARNFSGFPRVRLLEWPEDPAPEFRLVGWVTRASLRADGVSPSNQGGRNSYMLRCCSCHGLSNRTWPRCWGNQGGLQSEGNGTECKSPEPVPQARVRWLRG